MKSADARRLSPFSTLAIQAIRSIPHGCVATYGQIAGLAGDPRGARQVVRILHALSDRKRLPWHRVINSRGKVALKGDGFRVQRALLEQEGVEVGPDGSVDLRRVQWRACPTRVQSLGKTAKKKW
jgi:methylated-DNA-protein-cysteine methyltransferase-like protein